MLILNITRPRVGGGNSKLVLRQVEPGHSQMVVLVLVGSGVLAKFKNLYGGNPNYQPSMIVEEFE